MPQKPYHVQISIWYIRQQRERTPRRVWLGFFGKGAHTHFPNFPLTRQNQKQLFSIFVYIFNLINYVLICINYILFNLSINGLYVFVFFNYLPFEDCSFGSDRLSHIISAQQSSTIRLVQVSLNADIRFTCGSIHLGWHFHTPAKHEHRSSQSLSRLSPFWNMRKKHLGYQQSKCNCVNKKNITI